MPINDSKLRAKNTGFIPDPKKQPAQSSPVPSAPLAKPIAHQQHLLENLEANIDQMGDEFAHRTAEIIEQGIQNSYVKATDRIRAIELPFFGLKGSGSYFVSSQSVPVLRSTIPEEPCLTPRNLLIVGGAVLFQSTIGGGFSGMQQM